MKKINDMETIEERAYKAVPDMLRINDNYVASFVIGYCQGATEQRKIDIEKAVKWLDDNINDYLFNDNSNGKYRDWLKCSSQAFVDFRKAMEL